MNSSAALSARYHATRKEISRSRSVVLGYLLKLNKCIDAAHSDLVQALAHRFSDTLIDYISYGHFQLFETFAPEPHHAAALQTITQQALAFSDKYAGRTHIPLAELKHDLEQLALSLEVRFEIEDEVASLAD